MQVIILAAGKGERLMPLTSNTPKSLLQIGNGVTILEQQLENIKEVPEVKEVVLVLGYRAEQVEAKLRGYNTAHLQVRTVYNPFYAHSNNLISLWFARPYLLEKFVVLNGDNVFHHKILAGMLSHEVRGNIVMVIDHKDAYDQDDMKVQLDGNVITQVSKKIAVEKAGGESVGMIRFAGTGARKLKHVLDTMVREECNKNVFWLSAIQHIIDEGFPVHFYVCDRNDWAEIDFHPDFELIQSNLSRYSEIAAKWREPKVVSQDFSDASPEKTHYENKMDHSRTI